MTLTFTTAVLIFVNIWLLALSAFATAASAIFLYILSAVDNVIGASVAISLLCSWLSRICVQLPRVLIVSWIITTTAGLVVALRQPLCQSGDVKKNAAEWQSGLGCWMFRVLVSLIVVMLVLSFCIFVLLEINGRYVCIGLFHFEYASYDNTHKRRAVTSSTYAESQVSLASPVTIISEDEQNLASEKQLASTTISPSPTYRTIDNRRIRAQRSLSALDEESLLDLTASRRTTCTTPTLSTLPLSYLPTTPTSTQTPIVSPQAAIMASSQLSARPVSNIPALPASFQNQIKELEHMKAEHEATAAAIQKTNGRATRKPNTNLHNVALTSASMNNLNLKSSSALPLADPSPTQPLKNNSTSSKRRSISLEVLEQPPEWYPKPLKHDPLESDPAIKRLTELRRVSARVSRRLSFSGFEFGFGSRRTVSKVSEETGSDEESHRSPVNDGEVSFGIVGEDGDKKIITVLPDQHARDTKDKTKSTIRSVKGSIGVRRSIFPPAVPAPPPPGRGLSHTTGQPGVVASRRRGKSMVERGRYEKLPQ